MRALGMVRADSQSVQKGLQHLPRPRVLVDLVFSTSYLWEPKKYKNITNDLAMPRGNPMQPPKPNPDPSGTPTSRFFRKADSLARLASSARNSFIHANQNGCTRATSGRVLSKWSRKSTWVANKECVCDVYLWRCVETCVRGSRFLAMTRCSVQICMV